MNTMRKDGLFIFAIGSIAIGLAISYFAYAFWKDTSGRVGAPPEQRGFVVEVANQPLTNYDANFNSMRDVHATAVLLLANPADPMLPNIVDAARAHELIPWLAIPPSDKPEAYRASATAAATFCAAHHVDYLIIGMRLSESLGGEDYWKPLLTSLRHGAPNLHVIFVTEFDEYLWASWWGQSDMLAVSGEFPTPAERTGGPDKLKNLFDNKWAGTIHDMISFSLHDNQTGRPSGAAIIDVVVPAEYNVESADFYLRGLLHQSKRQPPKEKTESAAAGREPLAAIFLRGWDSGIRDYAGTFKSEWSDKAVTYSDTAPATAPSTSTQP